jgi:hypothetical protein
MRRVAVVLTTLLTAALLLLHVSLPHCVRGGAELTMSDTTASIEVPQQPTEPTLVHAFGADQTARSDTADRDHLIANCASVPGQRVAPPDRPCCGAAVSRPVPMRSVPDLSELQVYRC